MILLETYLAEKSRAIDAALKTCLPSVTEAPARLHEAMSYSVFAGGKRVRPVLVIAAAEACGGRQETVMPAACALELIHTYSLIHDDLPCMDDDDLRRGRPTSHKVFGEAIAVLAGDALLTHAFKLLTDSAVAGGVDAKAGLEACALVATAASSLGMVGGQAADCLAEGGEVNEGDVLFIHGRKTGALIRASVLAGAILAGAKPGARTALAAYGEKLGLLFQVVDDILNVTGDPAKLGKATGSDQRKKKATYPAVVGLERAKARAVQLAGEAKGAIEGAGVKTDILVPLADYITNRTS